MLTYLQVLMAHLESVIHLSSEQMGCEGLGLSIHVCHFRVAKRFDERGLLGDLQTWHISNNPASYKSIGCGLSDILVVLYAGKVLEKPGRLLESEFFVPHHQQ